MHNTLAPLSIKLILTLLFTSFTSNNFSNLIGQEEFEVAPTAVFVNSNVSNWKVLVSVDRNHYGISDKYQPLQLVVNNLL